MWSSIAEAEIFSLREILSADSDESGVSKDLSTFKCERDSDVERFLKEGAIPFEKAHKSRTYIVVRRDSARERELKILAYFSIALSNMKIRDTVSRSRRKRLSGIFEDSETPCYLIGQLAKNDTYEGDIQGKELIEYALSMFKIAHDLVGGRFVRVDCKNIPHLVEFYKANGFGELQTDDKTGLLQLVRFL